MKAKMISKKKTHVPAERRARIGRGMKRYWAGWHRQKNKEKRTVAGVLGEKLRRKKSRFIANEGDFKNLDGTPLTATPVDPYELRKLKVKNPRKVAKVVGEKTDKQEEFKFLPLGRSPLWAALEKDKLLFDKRRRETGRHIPREEANYQNWQVISKQIPEQITLGKVHWSCLDIEIIIWHTVCGAKHPKNALPVYQSSIQKFINERMLRLVNHSMEPNIDSDYVATEKGIAFVELLKQTPPPEMLWVDPRDLSK